MIGAHAVEFHQDEAELGHLVVHLGPGRSYFDVDTDTRAQVVAVADLLAGALRRTVPPSVN